MQLDLYVVDERENIDRMKPTIEQALREIAHRTALLRHFADALATSRNEPPDAAALSGLGDVCRDIEDKIRAIYRSLGADVLAIEVRL